MNKKLNPRKKYLYRLTSFFYSDFSPQYPHWKKGTPKQILQDYRSLKKSAGGSSVAIEIEHFTIDDLIDFDIERSFI